DLWVRGDEHDAEYEASHRPPAEISVPAELGRLDRNTPGDANNDAYNEIRASYEIVSFGRRVEITVTPRGVPALRPVFEIAGFPPGKVLATLQGRLITQIDRLPNGNVLVELPVKIDLPTTLNVRVE